MNIKMLLAIFGLEVYEFTDREREIADKVIDYYVGKETPKVSHNLAEDEAKDVLAACQYALAEEGWDWESVMMAKTRKREIIELRYAIISIFWKRTNISQSRRAQMLGGAFDRATLIHAIKQVDCWRQYDPAYRKLYNRLSQSAQAYLTPETSSDEANINV